MSQPKEHPLLRTGWRNRIECRIAAHLGYPWRFVSFVDLNDLSSHPCALLSDGRYAVFAKYSRAANAFDQFDVELNGLRLIADLSGALIPAPIGIVSADDTSDEAVLLLEAVQAAEQTPQRWRDIGRTLAHIHRVTGTQFGLPTHGYFGPVFQDNRPTTPNDWPTFYAERRLWPRLISAIDAGHMPIDIARKVEQVIARMPNLCGPVVQPTLLHGDAQKNNFISTMRGAVVIDPAVHYGHPELDLAYVDYFEPVPGDVFDGYREVMPIDPGFDERRQVWRISGWLAVVANAGQTWLPKLLESVEPYL